MTQEDYGKYISNRIALGYICVVANDVMGDGHLLFKSDTHSNLPRPIHFEFVRLLGNGELKSVSFAMTFPSFQQIMLAGIGDL